MLNLEHGVVGKMEQMMDALLSLVPEDEIC
jgi:hypothetical protein